MLEQIAEAIKRQDYQTADQLLRKLKEEAAENPWVQFYQARLDEANGNLETAESLYKQVLRNTTSQKIISQARQGIQRLAQIKEKQHQHEVNARVEKLAEVAMSEGSDELAVLVLEAIAPEAKQTAAQAFARIMQIDAYTARLQLPSRSWRLYRTGSLAELKFYTSEMKKAEIPCFCVPINSINQIQVYQAEYFESMTPQATVICQNFQLQQEIISFNFKEVTARVQGLLPLFEECVEVGVRGKLERKTKTLDYAQISDLHLPGKNLILRFGDRNYKFQQGIKFSSTIESKHNLKQTTRENWNKLNLFFQEKLPEVPVRSDFTAFAQTAIDFSELLKRLSPNINLFRPEETPWDAAFQLYSTLVFLKET